jgi:Lon protease-like protein
MESFEIPLFPLRVVLYPGGPLPLRIFEPRYLDMVSHCIRNDACFGVVGVEAGEADQEMSMFYVGTAARITDWYKNDDGLLGITAIGERRFHIQSVSQQANGLNLGAVTWLEQEVSRPVPDSQAYLSSVVMDLLDEFKDMYQGVPRSPDDASWLGYRLAELLPLSLAQKQFYLELEDPLERLERLSNDVKQLRGDA